MFVTNDVFAAHLQSFAELQNLVSLLQARISSLEAERVLPPSHRLSLIGSSPPSLSRDLSTSVHGPPPPPPWHMRGLSSASSNSTSSYNSYAPMSTSSSSSSYNSYAPMSTSYNTSNYAPATTSPSLSRTSSAAPPGTPPLVPLSEAKSEMASYDCYTPQPTKACPADTNSAYNAYNPIESANDAPSLYDAYVSTQSDQGQMSASVYNAYTPTPSGAPPPPPPRRSTSATTDNPAVYDFYAPIDNTTDSLLEPESSDTQPYPSNEERHKMALSALQPAREMLLAELEKGAANTTNATMTPYHDPNTSWFDRFLHAMNHSNEEMLAFSRDFHREVTKRARLILEEMNVPVHKKTIPPLSGAGGVAGGTKFLDNGILFKFANDPKVGSNHLYGGAEADPERAAKAAANDLKGANAYLTCWQEAKMPMIILPQIVMDFMGFRLIAMPWVEMKGSTIVAGSGDGGVTVMDEDEVTRSAFKYAASELHLAFHYVRGVGLYAAGDIEVHKAEDGKRYVLDLARTFPPEDPEVVSHIPYVQSAIFFRLHRASFLKHLKEQNSFEYPPLNPDAFSGWGQHRAAFHNQHVKHATKYMITTRVNELVKDLLTRRVPWTRLGAIIQSWGISIRHLGLIRTVCAKQRPESTSLFQPATVTSTQFDNVLHLELQLVMCMVARSGKNLLRQEMREAAVSKNVQQAIVTFLNTLVRTKTVQYDAFWSVKLPHDIIGRFGKSALFPAEENRLSELCNAHLPSIVFYICSTSGILLSPSLEMREIVHSSFEFSVNMIQDLSVRSKTLDIFEELLLRDLIEQACKARTASDFFTHVMHLSQKRLASPQLQAALDYINPPFAKIENSDGPEDVRLQCLILQCLALHFKGHTEVVRQNIYGGLERLEPEAIALLRALPQVFVNQRDLLSDALVIVCSKLQHEASTPAIVASLIEGQADVDAVDTRSGDPILHTCALREHFEVIELLLKAKADIAQKDRSGRPFFSILHPQDLGHFRAIRANHPPSPGAVPRSPSSVGSTLGSGSSISTPVGKHKGYITFTLPRLHRSGQSQRNTTLLRSDAARFFAPPGFRLRIHSISGDIKKLNGCFLQVGMRRATDSSDKETKTAFVNLSECNVEGSTMFIGYETFFEEWPEGHSLMLYVHQGSAPSKKGGTLLSKKPNIQALVARLSTGRPVSAFEVTNTKMVSKDTQDSNLTIYLDAREVIYNMT